MKRYIKTLTKLGIVTTALLFSAQISFAGSKTVLDEASVLATINNEPITIGDIEDRELNKTRIDFYNQIRRRLLVTVIEKLSESYPEYAKEPVIIITDKQVEDYYNDNNLRSRGPLDSLAPQIKILLESLARIHYMESLYAKAEAEGLLTTYIVEPDLYLLEVPLETAYVWGGENAKVMVLEFSDYQCPFCSRVQTTIDELRSKYHGTVAFAYRHAPLPFHREADEAAVAVECAREQGKFEELHRILFDEYRRITIKNLPKFASKAGVRDMKRFRTCLENEKYRPRLENDQSAAAKAGINGTPGFVIGVYDRQKGVVKGEILAGALPLKQFTTMIDKYLTRISPTTQK